MMYYLASAPSQLTQKLCIVAHGYGADEGDLQFLKDELAIKDATFIFTRAPQPCGAGYQWFPLHDEINKDHFRRDIVSVAQAYGSFIKDLQLHHGVTVEDTILMGFSQGAMLSLEVGLCGKELVAGTIVSFSGMLLGEPKQTTPRVLLVHGEEDPVVPCEASVEAFEDLRGLGICAELVLVPGSPHTIDRKGLQATRLFLGTIG